MTQAAERALANSNAVCSQTLEVFCAVLVTAAANLAPNLGAGGGIYVGGAIVLRLGQHFDRSPFCGRIEDKGRVSHDLAAIRTFVITVAQSTFTGASTILDLQLHGLKTAPGSAIGASEAWGWAPQPAGNDGWHRKSPRPFGLKLAMGSLKKHLSSI